MKLPWIAIIDPKLRQALKKKNIKTIFTLDPNLNDCNWTRTQNHLVRKRILNHLAKLTIECGFTLKQVGDMRKTYTQI